MSKTVPEDDRSRIEGDLAAFADPGSVKVSDGGRNFSAEWAIHGAPREATFTISPDRGVNVRTNGTSQPYHVFLADTEMADLRYMAQMIKRTASREFFVPTKAELTDSIGKEMDSAINIITNTLEQDHQKNSTNNAIDATQIVMITGEAGAGKTSVLRELVLRQSEKYLLGKSEKILLYINAQGRALARLNEALATELQDLKVRLTYHSIATLVRVGLIVPVIDGFDELLGASGYDDAFSSLAAFLEQLNSYGQLIVSARSTYYEEEFLRRTKKTAEGQSWYHTPVKICTWDEEDQATFIEETAKFRSMTKERKAALKKRARQVFKREKDLAGKPLFFSRVVDLLCDEGSDPLVGDDLLDILIDRFMGREQKEKLLDRQQRPLLTQDNLQRLMEELAEEMWNQETRELDLKSAREVADLVLEDSEVSAEGGRIVVERVPTLAFFSPGNKQDNILFEHEIFFFYFLSRVIVRMYIQDTDMHTVLGRSILPDFVAERMAFELRKQGQLSSLDSLQQLLDRLCDAASFQSRRTSQVRDNAGRIVMALLRNFADGRAESVEISGRMIHHVNFPGGDLQKVVLRKCTFKNVIIHGTDLTSTRFIDCNPHEFTLMEPKVKTGSTLLKFAPPLDLKDVIGIVRIDNDGKRIVYNPREIARIFQKCGGRIEIEDSVRDIDHTWLSRMEKLAHAYERTPILCIDDGDSKSIFKDAELSKLKDLLIEHGLVKRENRQTRGPARMFLRREFSPDQIMLGIDRANSVDRKIARFWDALENLSS